MKYKLKVTETAYDYGAAKPSITGRQKETLTRALNAGIQRDKGQRIKALEILIERAKTDQKFRNAYRNQLPKMEALLKTLKKSA